MPPELRKSSSAFVTLKISSRNAERAEVRYPIATMSHENRRGAPSGSGASFSIAMRSRSRWLRMRNCGVSLQLVGRCWQLLFVEHPCGGEDRRRDIDGLLHEVQDPAPNQSPRADHDEERSTRNWRHLPGLRHQDLQDRRRQIGVCWER